MKEKSNFLLRIYASKNVLQFKSVFFIILIYLGMVPIAHSVDVSSVIGLDAPNSAYYGIGGIETQNYGSESGHLYSELKNDGHSFSGNGLYANYDLQSNQNMYMSGVNGVFGYAVDDPHMIVQSSFTLNPEDRFSNSYPFNSGEVPAEYRWTMQKITYTITVSNFNAQPVNLNSQAEQWEILNQNWNYVGKTVNNYENFDYGADQVILPSNADDEKDSLETKLVKFAYDKMMDKIPYGAAIKSGIELIDTLKEFSDEPNVVELRPDSYTIKVVFTPPSTYADYAQAIETLNFAIRIKGSNNQEGYQKIHVHTDVDLIGVYSKYQNGHRFAFMRDYAREAQTESFDNDYWIGMGRTTNYRILEPVASTGGSIEIDTIANSQLLENGKFSMSNSLQKKWVAVIDGNADLRLTPIALEGYKFSHWEDGLGNKIISDTVYNDLTINSDGIMSVTGNSPFYYPSNPEDQVYVLQAVFDPIPISITIISPMEGTTIEGTINILFSISLPDLVANVTLLIDGTFYERDYFASTSITLYSNLYNDGLHTITIIVVAFTGANASDTITLNFQNTSPPPPPPPPPAPCGWWFYSDEISIEKECSL